MVAHHNQVDVSSDYGLNSKRIRTRILYVYVYIYNAFLEFLCFYEGDMVLKFHKMSGGSWFQN